MQLLDDIIADLNDFFGLVPPADRESSTIKQEEVESLPVKEESMEEVVFINPTSFSQVQSIADRLKSGKAVIVKLEEMPTKEATRTIDFVSGAIYALGGDTEKLGENIFLFTPQDVEISYE